MVELFHDSLQLGNYVSFSFRAEGEKSFFACSFNAKFVDPAEITNMRQACPMRQSPAGNQNRGATTALIRAAVRYFIPGGINRTGSAEC